jgi:hypothetical protein
MIRAIKLGVPALISVYNTHEVKIVLENPEDEKRFPLRAQVEEYEANRYLGRDYYPSLPVEAIIEYLKKEHWEILSYDLPLKGRRNYPEGTVF